MTPQERYLELVRAGDAILRAVGAGALAVAAIYAADRWLGWDPVAAAERILNESSSGPAGE